MALRLFDEDVFETEGLFSPNLSRGITLDDGRKVEAPASIRDIMDNLNTADYLLLKTRAWTATTFTIGRRMDNRNSILTHVNVWIRRTGNPGILKCSIRKASGMLPTGSDLDVVTLTQVQTNTGTALFGIVTFTFESDIVLEVGTQYCIVLNAPSVDAANYYWMGGNWNVSREGEGSSSSANGVAWDGEQEGSMCLVVYGVITD